MMKFLIVTGMLFIAAGFTPAEEGKHLFILSGQSNMAGLRPEESFIPTIEKKYGKEHVIVVKNAKGGQPIRRWDKSWEATGSQNTKQIGDLYDELMKAVKPQAEGQNLSSVTFVWMQGERDAREGNADLYEASFQRLLEQLKADLGIKELNFVIGRLSDFDMENKTYPHWTKMREVLVSIAEKSKNGEWVDTDDLNDGKNRRGKEIKNDLHYSADGYVTFGTRLAEKAIGLIEN